MPERQKCIQTGLSDLIDNRNKMLILILAQYGLCFQYFLSIYNLFIFSTKSPKFRHFSLSQKNPGLLRHSAYPNFYNKKGIPPRLQKNPHFMILSDIPCSFLTDNIRNSFYIQNVSNAVLSGICAFPTLQVTVIITVPFTFPLLLLKNLQALKGILRCPSFMVA